MLVNLVGLPDRKRVVQIFGCILVWFTFVDQFICFSSWRSMVAVVLSLGKCGCGEACMLRSLISGL